MNIFHPGTWRAFQTIRVRPLQSGNKCESKVVDSGKNLRNISEKLCLPLFISQGPRKGDWRAGKKSVASVCAWDINKRWMPAVDGREKITKEWGKKEEMETARKSGWPVKGGRTGNHETMKGMTRQARRKIMHRGEKCNLDMRAQTEKEKEWTKENLFAQ